MCGDESRHAVRTLYSDLIDDNEIRHPNHYCWSILLNLLNVMAIMEFSSPLISWQHHMSVKRGRTKYIYHSYFFGSTGQRFIYHMSVKRGRTKYNRAETKQSRAEHRYHPVVGWFLGSLPVRGAYQPDIYVQNFPSVVELDVSLCPKPKRATGLSRSQKTIDATMETLSEYRTSVSPR